MTSTREVVGYRLSRQQQQLWRTSENAGGKLRPARARLRLEGSLDIARLETSLHWVAQRHEALRARIELLPGTTQPIQVIDEATPALEVHDLGCFPPEERIPSLADIEANPRFLDLDVGAFHVELARLTADLHYLMIAASPFFCDFASLQNFVRDLAIAYGCGPEQAAQVPAPVQYVDYAAWQEDILSSEDGGEAHYWRREAPSDVSAVPLHIEIAPAGASALAQAVAQLRIPQERWRILEDLANRRGVASETIILAALAALLQRHSALPQIELSLVTDGRSDDISTAIGAFELSLPLMLRFEPGDSLDALAQRLQSSLEEHRDRQDFAPLQTVGNSALPICFEYRVNMPTLAAGAVLMTLTRRPS
jgi:hypothetical protein